MAEITINIDINSLHEIPLAYEKAMKEAEEIMNDSISYYVGISLKKINLYKHYSSEEVEYRCEFEITNIDICESE